MELNSWVIDHELVPNQAITNYYQTNIIIFISLSMNTKDAEKMLPSI